MYRHFALVTVVLTAGLAMFVDGENREAVAAHIEDAARRAPPAPANPATLGASEAERKPHVRAAEFASDGSVFDDTFGLPMDRPYLRRGNTSALPPAVASQASLAGYSEEYLASLGDQERELLLKGLEEQGLLSSAERRRKSAALVAASHRRSGGLQSSE